MVTSYLSQDQKMIDAFKNGQDIYSTIAALAFHKTYEECLEFYLDEQGNKTDKTNKLGKERRTQAKSIVLGILYGRQIPSIAEQLDVTTQEAQNIYDSVLKAFPQLAEFITDSQNMARETGYVTTAWGRRRHLPDMQLKPYEYKYDGNVVNFDPLAFGDEVVTEVPESLQREFNNKFKRCRGWKQRNELKEQLREYEGIIVKDNTGYIAEAERQCVNSRVQGSAADMAKIAMIVIDNDEKLKELDFHLLIQVHDEVIGECPEENMKECAERLSYLMRTAPTDKIDLPFKCDTEITRNWYGEPIEI